MAFTRAFGRVLVDHQVRAQQIPRAVLPAIRVDYQPFLATPDPLLAQTMAVLIDLYYDLTCQDLAPEFEDRHETFFAEGTGYFMQLMAWDPPQLQTDVRRRCLSPSVHLHALTRPEPLSARRINAVLIIKDPHGRHRDRRGVRIHFPLLFID